MIIDLDAPANQSHIAKAIGRSQQAVSKLVQKIGLKPDMTNYQMLSAIFDRLSAEAAGRGGDHHSDLTLARIRETNMSADLKEIQMMEKAGHLVPVAQVETAMMAMVSAAKAELLTLPEKIAGDVKAVSGFDIDPSLIQQRIDDALIQLAGQPVDISE